MSSKQRRRFGAEKKAQIVRRHLADKVPVSDLADEFGVQPSQIHTWVKQVLDRAEKAFERPDGPRRNEAGKDAARCAKIAQLEEKLATKNEVISELMEENVKAKKASGEL
jgi:transposase